MTLLAGIDIGGTKTAAALFTDDGTLIRRTVRPTPAAHGPGAVLDSAAAAVAAVGVGSAGVIDPVGGRVLSATRAMPGWAGTDLRGELAARLGVPVAVDNDVHAHALGEAWRGKAAGLGTVLLIAVGTGVGACLLLDGAVQGGARGAAGEAGHFPVPEAAGRTCACGGVGHVEAAASGPAMTAEYRRPSEAGAVGLTEIAGLAEAGDQRARRVIRAGARALGELTGGLVNLLAPHTVVIGGGVSRCGATWWDALRTTAAAHLLPAVAATPIGPGRLGEDAALYGAARLGRRALA